MRILFTAAAVGVSLCIFGCSLALAPNGLEGVPKV